MGVEQRSASVRVKAGRRPTGPAGYQEAGCATLSFYDAEGERLDTRYLGRMPEPKKATLKTMLSAELDAALGRRPDLCVVKVADGARDNWSYLDALTPEGTSVVDFYHAAEQLKAALDAGYGENDGHRSKSGNSSLHTRAAASRGTQCSGSGCPMT